MFLINLDFCKNFRKCAFWSKFSEILNSGQNFWETWFRSQFLEFSINFQTILIWAKIVKLSIFVKKCKVSRFLSIFTKILILVKIHKILDFGLNFRKCWFWSKFSENIDFRQNFLEIWHWSKFSKNVDFSQDFRKSWFLSKISEIMSNFVKIFDDPDFSQNFR